MPQRESVEEIARAQEANHAWKRVRELEGMLAAAQGGAKPITPTEPQSSRGDSRKPLNAAAANAMAAPMFRRGAEKTRGADPDLADAYEEVEDSRALAKARKRAAEDLAWAKPREDA